MGMLWKEDVTPEPSTSITIININQELILFLLSSEREKGSLHVPRALFSHSSRASPAAGTTMEQSWQGSWS